VNGIGGTEENNGILEAISFTGVVQNEPPFSFFGSQNMKSVS